MAKEKIPALTIPRLSLYHRALLESDGNGFISSEKLSTLTGFTAAQVRRDLTYFGQFGTPGKGYRIDELRQSILEILGTNKKWNVALLGVGNLGSALLSYRGFVRQGFKITCAFDNDLRKIGKSLEGVTIRDITELERIIKKENIQIAIVTVPQKAVQDIVDKLVKAGVRAILNFAPLRPRLPSSVKLLNIDLSIELERLAYFLTRSSFAQG